MNESSGSKGTPYIECTNRYIDKWRVRWDMQEHKDEYTYKKRDEETGEETDEEVTEVNEYVTFWEEDFKPRPTLQKIKEKVLEWYNTKIDEKIISGYVWKDNPVWLSTENQFNYKAAYDLAVQTEGASLPVTFKFGDDENPTYYSFTNLEEITDFYQGAMAWVNQCLAEGWKEKDGIDWGVYEKE